MKKSSKMSNVIFVFETTGAVSELSCWSMTAKQGKRVRIRQKTTKTIQLLCDVANHIIQHYSVGARHLEEVMWLIGLIHDKATMSIVDELSNNKANEIFKTAAGIYVGLYVFINLPYMYMLDQLGSDKDVYNAYTGMPDFWLQGISITRQLELSIRRAIREKLREHNDYSQNPAVNFY